MSNPQPEVPDFVRELANSAKGDTPRADVPIAVNPNGNSAYGRKALKDEATKLTTTPEGSRNHQLNTSSFSLGQLVAGGELHQSDVENALQNAARMCGLADGEILKTLHSGLSAGMLEPRTAPVEQYSPVDIQVPEDPEPQIEQKEGAKSIEFVASSPLGYTFTDLGNAERFIDQHGEDVRFCEKWGRWLIWDGQRWKIDESSEIIKRGHETVRAIYREAAITTDDDQRKKIAKHALGSEARTKVENMIKSAIPYLPISPNQLDQDAMLLNCANGMVDLKTGNLLPHDKSKMMTKLAEVEYDPESECLRWIAFLDMVMAGDKDLQYFLQCAAGYSLTGRTDEHCIFFPYGLGANGKTTFTETIRRYLGDYAQRIDIEALMQSYGRGQSATPYLANLAGARFVLSSEVPENRKLNESLVKDLTGGDSLTARYLFGNPFTFEPTHKLWIFGNYKPRITGTDYGIWRRIRVIPFNVTIPENIRRPMSEVLAMFEEEFSGILTWAVRGCLFWQSSGLEMPEAVKDATSEYQTEQDLVQQFLEEQCEMHTDFLVLKDDLYSAWRTWCENAGEESAKRRSKKWLTRQMTDRGFEHGGRGKKWLNGVQLTN